VRILWVTKLLPEPPTDGMLLYSGGLLRAVGRAGAAVTVVCGDPGGRGGPPGVTWLTVPAGERPRWVSLASSLPAMAVAARLPGMARAVEHAAAAGPWDAVVIDHLQMAWALRALDVARRHGAALALVSQNHETSVRAALARDPATPAVERNLRRLDAAKIARLERRTVTAVDLVTAITADDAGHFARMGPTPVAVIAPGFEGTVVEQRRIDASVPRRVMVHGSFEWSVKQDNLARLLGAIDRPLAEAGVEVVVVGSVPDSLRDRLAPLAATRFLGRVPDLAEPLSRSRFGIIAEPGGGGFKMKSFDYVFSRVPIVALHGSMQGLALVAGRDHLEAASLEDLAPLIVGAIDDDRRLNALQEGAFECCRTGFSWADRGAELLAALEAASSAVRP